jgi:hypothetical protein
MDGLVGGRREKPLPIFREWYTLDSLVMVVERDEAGSFSDVPNPNLPVVCTRNHFIEGEGALGEHADSVGVTSECT